MSHYTIVNTQIVSAKHLTRALGDLGFADVEVHSTPQPLVGWMGLARENQANVIIRRKYLSPSSNDIGFAKNASGTFDALISDWDRPTYDNKWLQQLSQRYAYHVATDLLDERDFSLVEEECDQDGTIHLTLRRMG
jgi:hypothetical protein